MTVRVLLFARYQEAAGRGVIEVEVPEGATIGAVWEAIRERVPALRGENAPLMALDRAYASPDQPVGRSREVAFFPAVSGG